MRIRFLIFAVVVLSACGGSATGDFPVAEGRCENRKPTAEFVSPDRLYKAVEFNRRCGADQPSLNISVLPISAALPDAPGNALIDVPPKDIGGYKRHINMMWSEGHKLTIEHGASMQIEMAATSVGDLPIVQRTVAEDAT